MDNLIFPRSKFSLIYDGLFLAVLALVIIIKFQDLFLPFFWDEAGVYGLAVNYQFAHSLSLMPNAVPSEFSHGHPLMFPFLSASAWRVLGNSMFAVHSFALIISLLLLVVIYKKTSAYFNPTAGLVSVFFLSAQPLFLAQSCLILPEVMLALFALLSLTSYFERNYVAYALWASCAILTKESAIVIPASCLAFSMLQAIMYRRLPSSLNLRNLILTLVPYAVFLIFISVQKQQYGWYFFPYHIGSITLDINNFLAQFPRFFDSVFWCQGRYWAEKLLLAALGVALISGQITWRNFGKSFLTLLGIFMLGFLCFCSISTFYMDRYAFAVLDGAAILLGAGLTAITKNKVMCFGISVFLACIACQYWQSSGFGYDSDLGYRQCVRTLKLAIDYCESVKVEGQSIDGPFPACYALYYPETGYIKREQLNAITAKPYYIIETDPGTPITEVYHNRNLELIREFKDGFAVTRIYKVQ